MKKFYLILFFLFSVMNCHSENKRVALVIGNQNYEGSGFTSLLNPMNDAKAMASKLKSMGFTISSGSPLIDCDKKQMMDAIRKFRYDSQDAEIALFYYSGHGASRDNVNLLLPTGETFEKEGIQYQAIGIDYVRDMMKSSDSRLNLIILDACRNAPYRNPFDSGDKKGEVADANGGLVRVKPPKGFIYCYATSPGKTAGQGKIYSPFTEALLSEIDSNKSFSDIFYVVKSKVKKATNNFQDPRLDLNELEGTNANFYLNGHIESAPISTIAENSNLFANPLSVTEETVDDLYNKKQYSDIKKLAFSNNMYAMNNLGYCYYYGHGEIKSFIEAAKWFRKAAELGYSEAQYNIGYCYKAGIGVTQSSEEAMKWFMLASENQEPMSQYEIGLAYETGLMSVEKSADTAFDYFQRSAYRGFHKAEYKVGYYYQHGLVKNAPVEYGADYEAISWYRKAAEKGNADAMYALGLCYEAGEGVGQNANTALEWYKKAAKKGQEQAITVLQNRGILDY